MHSDAQHSIVDTVVLCQAGMGRACVSVIVSESE